EEHHHGPEAGRTKLAERHRPGKQERHLEVEDDEEDGDQVEADVELQPGVVEGVETALIRRQLFRVRLLKRHDEGRNQQHEANEARYPYKDDKWKIVLQNAAHWRALFPASRG